MSDYKFIKETGTVLPDTADLQAEVVSEYKAALGDDLQTTPDTPQGVLITGEVLARSETLALNAQLANQLNPNLAGGVFLDAVCALFGLERATATRTLVRDVSLTGQPLTLIPAGVRARTDAGDLFESVGSVALDGLGVGAVDFQSVEFGPIPAPVGELVTVVDSVLGWETVNNTAEGILGVAEQSDLSLRDLRRRTLALQGISTVEAIVSNLSALPGVKSLQFRENIAATPQVIDGINMVAHSVWACVDGGTDLDIATSLLNNKTNGAAWNGAEVVDVLEPFSGQEYEVKFDRPTPVPMLIRVTIRAGQSVANAPVAVKNALLEYVNGTIPGERGFVVGGNVSPFELSGAIGVRVPGVFVAKVEVAPVSTGVYQTTEYVIAIDEVPSTTSGSITVIEL